MQQYTDQVLNMSLRFTSTKGWCLHSDDIVNEGTFLFEYLGDLISTVEAKERWKRQRILKSKNYIMSLKEHYGEDMTIVTRLDASEYGNISRFVNHSCDANCRIESVRVSGSMIPHLAFFTKRRIDAGEELTVDYASSDSTAGGGVECFCGSSGCRGTLPFEE